MQHRYTLERYKGTATRHRCPACGRNKIFVRYIDTETGNYVAEHVGRCNREVNCGYHVKPRDYFKEHPHETSALNIIQRRRKKPQVSYAATTRNIRAEITAGKNESKTTLIPYAVFKGSLAQYSGNYFVQYLNKLLGEEAARRVINKYYVGTGKHWPGANVYWQINRHRQIINGKVMLYNPVTGKRSKTFTWVHKLIQLPGYELTHCLFGEHLLHEDAHKPIAIVESEKTAMIASAYLPEFTWMASGGKSNLTIEKLQILKHRAIMLYPDLLRPGAENNWAKIAGQLKADGFTISLNAVLDAIATPADYEQGLDIADYLARIAKPVNNSPIEIKSNVLIHPTAVEPLKQMIAKNPKLQKLMDVLGIVEVGAVNGA